MMFNCLRHPNGGTMPHPSSTTTTEAAMLYAVAHDADGRALELTVFADGAACSVHLSTAQVEQLVHLLNHRSQ